jgi:hypothetical protein
MTSKQQQISFVEDLSLQDAFTTTWTDLTTPRENLKFHDLIQRAVLAHHLDWTTATTTVRLNLFNDIPTFTESTLIAYLDYLAYNRFNLTLTFKLNGTPFHQGMLMVSWIPPCPHTINATVGRREELETLSGYPHLKLQASSSDSVSLEVPYALWSSRIRRGDYSRPDPIFGTLIIEPVIQLAFATGATSSISMNTWIKFDQVSPSGYTVPEAKLAMTLVSTAACQACGTGPCSCTSLQAPPVPPPPAAAAQAQAADPFGAIGGAVGEVMNVANSIGGIMGLFLDKPVQPTESAKMTRKTASSWAHAVGSTNATALAFTPTLTDPAVESELPERVTLKKVIQTPAIFSTIQISTSFPENDLLFSIPVTPFNPRVQSAGNPYLLAYTPLSYVASAFTYWRGSITYKFQMVSTAFQQMTLAFVWIPDKTTLTPITGGYSDNASYVYHKVVEFQSPKEETITIPYLGRQEMKLVGLWNESESTTDRHSREPQMWESWNGVLQVYIVNKMTVSNNVPTTVNLVCWQSAGNDMEFHYPSAPNLSAIFPRSTVEQTTWVEIGASPPAIDAGESPFISRMRKQILHLRAGNQVTSVSTAAMMEGSANVPEPPIDEAESKEEPLAPANAGQLTSRFGESHMDMYKIMKRMYPVLHHTGGDTIAPYSGADYATYFVFIPVTPQLTEQVDAPGTGGPGRCYGHPLAFFSSLAYFWRGSLEYRIVLTNPNLRNHIVGLKASFLPLPYAHAQDVNLRANVSVPAFGTYGASTKVSDSVVFFNPAPPYQDFLDKYGFELEQTYQQGTLSVTVPYVSHMPYTPLGANVPAFDDADTSRGFYPLTTVTGWLALQVTVDVIEGEQAVDSTIRHPNLHVYMGAGDDFRYLLQAPPGSRQMYPLSTRVLPST